MRTIEKIQCKNKKQLHNKIMELRREGFFLVTFGYERAELEKENIFVILEVVK